MSRAIYTTISEQLRTFLSVMLGELCAQAREGGAPDLAGELNDLIQTLRDADQVPEGSVMVHAAMGKVELALDVVPQAFTDLAMTVLRMAQPMAPGPAVRLAFMAHIVVPDDGEDNGPAEASPADCNADAGPAAEASDAT